MFVYIRHSDFRPRVYVVVPPPIYEHFPAKMYKINHVVINHHLPSIIPDVAAENHAMVVNAFKAMGGTYSTYTHIHRYYCIVILSKYMKLFVCLFWYLLHLHL